MLETEELQNQLFLHEEILKIAQLFPELSEMEVKLQAQQNLELKKKSDFLKEQEKLGRGALKLQREANIELERFNRAQDNIERSTEIEDRIKENEAVIRRAFKDIIDSIQTGSRDLLDRNLAAELQREAAERGIRDTSIPEDAFIRTPVLGAAANNIAPIPSSSRSVSRNGGNNNTVIIEGVNLNVSNNEDLPQVVSDTFYELVSSEQQDGGVLANAR